MSDYERIRDLVFNAPMPSDAEIEEFCQHIVDCRQMPRKERPRQQLNPTTGKESIELCLRLLYNDNDENFMIGELTKTFGNRKVAKYLLEILESDLASMLVLLTIRYPDTPPLLMLSKFCSGFSEFNSRNIIHTVVELYDLPKE